MVIFWGRSSSFAALATISSFAKRKPWPPGLKRNWPTRQEIAALRMQLNPHFLFNTMNSMSPSLMRSDIDAADSMLEQMSSLLRMTLERRDVQLISLHDEIPDFHPKRPTSACKTSATRDESFGRSL